MDVAEEIMQAGCITGDRINGPVGGISGSWYIKFDTFTPAAERGVPVTRAISRMTLQQILGCGVGDNDIMNESNVVNFKDGSNKVSQYSWYAFHKEPPGGADDLSVRKPRLRHLFGGWCDNVVDLIHATDEEVLKVGRGQR